jgi:DNA modification methylase
MDCFEFIEKLPDESINMVMTSPPYWGLRDYDVEGQIGLEPDFRDYIKKLLEVFHELKRVLKNDGSFYLNMGDTYSASGGAGGQYDKWHSLNRVDGLKKFEGHRDKKISAKCLLGIPWRIALSLIDDKWILRNDIIWHKPNAMPSSVKDRLTNTHEHVFHFVKNKKYYYKLDAIRAPHKCAEKDKRSLLRRVEHKSGKNKLDNAQIGFNGVGYHPLGKNPGDVFLTKRACNLIDFFKRKGSGGNPGHGIEGSTLGSGHTLGKNPGDVLEYDSKYAENSYGQSLQGFIRNQSIAKARQQSRIDAKLLFPNDKEKQQEYINFIHDHSGHPLGKNPGDFWNICTRPFKGAHFAVYPETLCIRPILSSSRTGDVVLDPFIGSGTTAVVAKRLGRRFSGCDIKPEYVKMAEERLKTAQKILQS